jgi:hypothetical protein
MRAIFHANRYNITRQQRGEAAARELLAVSLAHDKAQLCSGHTQGGKVTRVFRLFDGSKLAIADEGVDVQAMRPVA